VVADRAYEKSCGGSTAYRRTFERHERIDKNRAYAEGAIESQISDDLVPSL